jgi:hypothetical protein
MNFSKFSTLLISLLLVSCSVTEESNVSTIQAETSTTSNTLASTESQESFLDIDIDLALDNFDEFWETLLKEDNPLTLEELVLTYNLNELMNEDFNWYEGTGAYFYLNEFTCNEKVRGTVPIGYLDENHPIGLTDPNAYAPSYFWGYCSNETSEDVIGTFGVPFFQDGTWWTFANTDIYSNVLSDCRKIYEPCLYTFSGSFTTRMSIEIPDDYIIGTDGPFNEYWTFNKLKSYPQLTQEEIEISNTINEDKISYLILADGTECTKDIGGLRTGARLDEVNPLEIKEDRKWGFLALQSYSCSDENRPGRLFGEFFYQDGKWWTFVEQSEEEIAIEEPWERMDLNVWKFATRTEITPGTFTGNYTCRADADYIERVYEKKEVDNYYFYKDKEIDYSTPNTLDELDEIIALLEKAQKYYKSALALRLGYNFGDVEDLDFENSYIDAVLYGMIVNTKDNLRSKYAMRNYVIENGQFETNAEVTKWWMANSTYSAVEWRTTDEYVEFYIGKMEDREDYGNHIIEDYIAPNPDWVISEEYPKYTLREKCEN